MQRKMVGPGPAKGAWAWDERRKAGAGRRVGRANWHPPGTDLEDGGGEVQVGHGVIADDALGREHARVARDEHDAGAALVDRVLGDLPVVHREDDHRVVEHAQVIQLGPDGPQLLVDHHRAHPTKTRSTSVRTGATPASLAPPRSTPAPGTCGEADERLTK